MTLKEWLKKQEKGAASKLAKTAAVSKTTITNLTAGDVPSVALALRIANATGGSVSVTDWPDIRPGAKRRNAR